MAYLAPELQDQGYTGVTGTTPYQPTTAQQIAALQNQYVNALSGHTLTASTPGATHININFDGTQNNRDFPAEGEAMTNIGQIARLQEQGADQRNTIYMSGIGAQTVPSGTLDAYGNPAPGSSPSNWESTPWKAGEIGNEVLEKAYIRLTTRVAEIRAADPNAVIELNLSGFSRGGAEAVAFANLLNERGIPGLYPAGGVPINSMALYDPVSQTDGTLNVNWPTNLRNPALVFVATAENRIWFPGMPVDTGSIIVPIEAVHSDVGGSFNPDGISAVTLKIAHDYLTAAGAPMDAIPVDLQPNWDHMYVHNSAIDNYGNVQYNTIGEPTATVGTHRYYEGTGLGSLTVQDMLGRDINVVPVYEEHNGRFVLTGFSAGTSHTVTDEVTGNVTETRDITLYARDGKTITSSALISITKDSAGQIISTQDSRPILDANGTSIGTQTVQSQTVSGLTTTTTTQSYTDGRPDSPATLTLTDAQNRIIARGTLEQFAVDDSTRQTLNYSDGRTVVTDRDNSGIVTSITETVPQVGGGSVVTIRNTTPNITEQIKDSSGTITRTTETIPNGDGTANVSVFDNNNIQIGSGTTTTMPNGVTSQRVEFSDGHSENILRDADGKIISQSTLRKDSFTGITTEDIVNADGSHIRLRTDAQGNEIERSQNNGIRTAREALQGVQDAFSLISAIQSGKPLPILASGLKLATRFSNDTNLGNASSIVNGVLSVYNLSQTLKHGSDLDKVIAATSLVGYAANAVAALSTNAATMTAANEVSTTIFGNSNAAAGSGIGFDGGGSVLGYLSAINDISKGNYVGAIMDIIAMIPVWGQIAYLCYVATQAATQFTDKKFGHDVTIALFGPVEEVDQIVNGFFGGLFGDDDPPLAWGNGSYGWYGSNARVIANGDNGGTEQVRGAMQGLLDNLQTIAANATSANPDYPFGVIPNRLPSLSWRDYQHTDGNGWSMMDVDPTTGAERAPGIWYDNDWRATNAPPGSDQQYQNLGERFINSAVERGAIAPWWEVQTARMQTEAGDPKAGLTEEERAAREGKYIGIPNGEAGTQTFRPVALDLSGNGRIDITDKDHGVSFNVDDSGYYKQTAWLDKNSGDGFLFLDRNFNGIVDEGKELFNNGRIDLSARGLNGIAWIDANGDGSIDASDPVFSQLRVWTDANGDGVENTTTVNGVNVNHPELKTLAELSITQLNYKLGTFEQDGQLKRLSSPDLEADTLGQTVTQIQGGLYVKSSNGQTSIVVTQISPSSRLDANADLIDNQYEDVTTLVSPGDLLANDSVGGLTGNDPNNGLQISNVFNSRHGSASIDPNGFIRFTPEANYNGNEAGFEYTVTAPTGQTTTTFVDINVQAVNDAPTATVTGGGHGGGLIVSDADDASGFTYKIVGKPAYGDATVDANGNWQYINWAGPNQPGERWSYSNPNPISDGYSYDGTGHNGRLDPFLVKVTDPHGASSTVQVNVYHVGEYYPNNGGGGGGGCGFFPVVVDLGSNGFHFTDLNDSNVFVDVNSDGWRHRMAWTRTQDGDVDGLLAFDLNGNGKVDSAAEFSFTRFGTAAQTDLEGLQTFDSSNDGVFSVADEKWASFGIWRDANQNGLSDDGEYQTLDQLGVQSLTLNSDGQFSIVDGQTVHGVGTITMTDGSTHQFADVTFKYNDDILLPQADGSTQVMQHSAYSPNGETITGTADADVLLGKVGNNIVFGLDGDDVILEDSGNDYIAGAAGDDALYAGADDDVVEGGTGNDTIFSGSGHDLVLAGEGDDVVFGEVGNDILFGNKGNDFISGGIGNDLLDGNEGDDEVFGEQGSDALFGGAGNDQLFGLDDDDLLDGGAGDDLLDGGLGADEMKGGAGNDTYMVDHAGDTVTENADEGIDAPQEVPLGDTVKASVDYVLSENVEHLTLLGAPNLHGTGNALDNTLLGNTGSNVLDGGAGIDWIDGGFGADAMSGGAGDDTYVVDNADDTVIENDGEGNDAVRASVAYALSDNVESLMLTGTTSIGATGNALDNALTGNSGNNMLDGGAGADTMMGGAGNDLYIVDNTADSVIERISEGIDTVHAGVSYALAGHVEHLTLTGAGDINAIGNALNNVVIGNSGNNVLDGGTGADTLAGGAGSDTYIVDQAGDVVTEQAGEGVDSVLSSVSFALSADVEHLTLTGVADIAGTGNALDNIIHGNAGNNVLDGGAGADALAGGAGNDRYIVDAAGDVVTEDVDAGIDTAQASVSYTLADHVEHLTLTGAADIDATGNALDNIILGNDGNNLLDGGAGADALAGGAGNDRYVVDAAGDLVTEGADAGIDTVQASVSYALADHVEHLTLTGAADIDATGNALDNVLTGNSGSNVLNGGAGTDTLAGGAGNDSYIVDATSDVVAENADEGVDTVLSSASYVLSDHVEHLTLTDMGDVNATGNALDNFLIGNVGSNVLDGGAGADTMLGGAGNDSYIVDNTGDVVTEYADQGIDTILSGVSYVLPEHVENLIMTGTGNADSSGNGLDNTLTGNGGNNLLDGGAGADTMIGGAGDDTYIVDNSGDVVVENPDEGNDMVRSSVSYALSGNVENMVLTGSADTNALGNSLNNTLTGNAGSNVLDGGAGADTMSGGLGDDSYIVDDSGDLVIENPNEGNDSVFASINYALTDNVENLTLTGTAALNGTGNTLDNVLTGNGSNNVLDGGAGVDVMIGGAGNDTYIVDHADDMVFENASEGTDNVFASVGYTLSANVENMTLTGSADINATGNTLNNVLTGNSGSNVLDGGTGADTMSGGAGNDTYIVDNTGDIVIESANAGTDTVNASATATLSANVENLMLTGSANINGTGNSLANSITGNSGNNVLKGMGGNDTFAGGTGKDTLTGGSGCDTYLYNLGDGLDTLSDSGGADSVVFGSGLSLNNVSIRITTDANCNSTARLRVLDANGCEQPDQGIDFAVTVDSYGCVTSPIETFRFADGSTKTFDNLRIKNQTTNAGSMTGAVVTGRNDDTVYAGRYNTSVSTGTGNDIVYASSYGTVAYSEGGDDYLQGNCAVDRLDGGWGIDILTGSSGNDVLSDPGGNSALLGGSGADVITSGAGNNFIAGGTGNDTITLNGSNNVVAYDGWDGWDTLIAGQGSSNNTLSLGGELNYSDLSFRKSGDNLLLDTGQGYGMTFQGWYANSANRNFVTLQVIEESSWDYDPCSSNKLYNKRIETFDFAKLANQFDQARTANTSLTSWCLTNGLLNAFLSNSDTAAIGGDLAHEYGMNWDLSCMGVNVAQDTLKSTKFGTQAQTLSNDVSGCGIKIAA